MHGEKVPSLVPGLSPARARAGRAGHNRRQGEGQHHGPVVAHDDRVRAAARGVRDQQPEPHVQHGEGDEGMRDQHPDGGTGGTGGGLRKHLGAQG